jgi:ribonuclease HI
MNSVVESDGLNDTSYTTAETVAFLDVLEKLPPIKEPGKTATLYCDGSTSPNPGPSGYGIWGLDENNNEYTVYGYVGDNETNNRAELFGFIRVLQMAKHFQWESVKLYVDSSYVVDGATKWIRLWKRNGWKNKAGNYISNLKEWQQVADLMEEVKATGCAFSIEWVRGHDGVDGNERADQIANQARRVGKKRKIACWAVVTQPTKKPALQKNRLISGNRLVFATNTSNRTRDEKHLYFMTKFDDAKAKDGRYIGKPSADTFYGVLITDNPIEELECIIQQQNQITPNDFNNPVIVMLDRVFRKDNLEKIKAHKGMNLRNNRLNVTTEEGEPLTIYLRQPRQAYEALDLLDGLLERLDNYRFQQPMKAEIHDITDQIYIKGKKLYKLRPEHSAKKGTLDVTVPHEGKSVEVKLTFDIDIPARNNFVGLAKDASQIKVSLMKYDCLPNVFRYCVIVETDLGIAIYRTAKANLKTLY